MVLQRGPQRAHVWGWSKTAGSTVTVKMNAKSYQTTSAADGAWSILLDPTNAGTYQPVPTTIRRPFPRNNNVAPRHVVFG